MKQVILATQSQQRQQLFATLSIPFTTAAADLDELHIQDPNHAIRAAKVASAKAEKIAKEVTDSIIIAADTFVVLNDERLEKPLDENEAIEMLHKISGQTVKVYTGWAYMDMTASYITNRTTVAELTFRTLSREEIKTYVERNPVTRWAGGFSLITVEGVALVASIQGSLTAVLGLPIEEIVPLIKESGLI